MLCTKGGKKKHNYFAVSCEELYQLKNVITAVLWAQQSWFLFVILSYYASSLQNYLGRNNYTQCSQIQSTTDCSKLENLILNIYIMLSCFCFLSLSDLFLSCKLLISLAACLWRYFLFESYFNQMYVMDITENSVLPCLAVFYESTWSHEFYPLPWTFTYHSKSTLKNHMDL